MITDQVVSISELRKNATTYVNKVSKTKKPQYIFINNKPKAMIVNLDYGYEGLGVYDRYGTEYAKPYPEEEENIKEYEKNKIHKEDKGVEGFSFLNSLK